MSYRARHGDTILTEATAGYEWWVVSASGLAAELTGAGLDVDVEADLIIGRQPHASSTI